MEPVTIQSDRPIWKWDGPRRVLMCPACDEQMLEGVGGWTCPWCGRDVAPPRPPPDPASLCPHCGRGTRPRIDEEGRWCEHCRIDIAPWEDRWQRLRDGERAVVALAWAWTRTNTVPSWLGPLGDRLTLGGDVQLGARPESFCRPHEILGDLAPRWDLLDREDQLHLVLSVPDIVARMDGEPAGSRTGRHLDIAEALSAHRLERFRGAHIGRRDAVSRAIVRYGLECRGGHLARQGYCPRCGKWHRAGKDGHRRARCFCAASGTRIRWGITVGWQGLGRMYNNSLRRWERVLREERVVRDG